MNGKLLLCLGVVAAIVLQVQAVFIPTYIPPPVREASNPHAVDIAGALRITEAQLGLLLYKSDTGDSLFNTVIANTPPPPGEQTATLTYMGEPMSLTLTYIIVKDGKAGWTIWDARAWDGVDTIQLDNRDLWNPTGSALSGISHIAIYGTYVPQRVPDSGLSFVLLGLGLLSVAGLKRNASP